MKIFWDALIHPARGRWTRWAWTLTTLFGIGANLWAGVRNILDPEAGLWWIASVLAVTWLVFWWCYFMMLKTWIPEDEKIRSRQAPIITGTARAFLRNPPPPGTPMPNMDGLPSHIRYVLGQAYRTGEAANIYQDENGVWRDSITDAPIKDEDN